MGEGGQNEVSLEAAPKRGPPSPTPLLFVPQNHKTLVYHTPYCCGLTLSCHDWMIGAPTCGCSVIIYLRTGSSKKHSISPSGNTIRNNASMHTAERRNFWRWTYLHTRWPFGQGQDIDRWIEFGVRFVVREMMTFFFEFLGDALFHTTSSRK